MADARGMNEQLYQHFHLIHITTLRTTEILNFCYYVIFDDYKKKCVLSVWFMNISICGPTAQLKN